YSSGFNYHHSGDGVFGNTFKVVNSPVLRFKSLKRPVIILLDESKNIISDSVLLSKQLDFIRRADSQIKDSLIISTSGSNKYISTPNDRYWDIQIKVIPEAHYVMFATNSITGSLEVEVFENDWNKVELSYIKESASINRNAIQL